MSSRTPAYSPQDQVPPYPVPSYQGQGGVFPGGGYPVQAPYPPGAPGFGPGSGYLPGNAPPPYVPPPKFEPPPGQVITNSSEDDTFAASPFTDKSIRRAFIRKVYLILTAQLLVTSAFIVVFQSIPSVKLWVRLNQWFYWCSYAVFFCTYIALVCCPSVRRRYPGNFIALTIFTLSFSYMTGTISSFYDTYSVLIAVGITAGVCLVISIFAIQGKIDFTKCSALLLILSIVLLLTGLACGIVYAISPSSESSKVLHAVYGGLGALVFSLYLAFDTQMIIGGRKHELSPEEYIYGALQLYMDVVNLFLMLLSLVGIRD